MSKFIDLTGQKFGRLTVIERTEDKIRSNGKSVAMWLCKCDCGKYKKLCGETLRKGEAKSCGCLRVETVLENRKSHEMTQSKIYRKWIDMKRRCYYPKSHGYENYGGRGITVCDEWLHNFQAFYDWAMANGYRDDLTIDRIDVNGNYEPSNCRWSNSEEQHNNKRNNHYLTYNGETKTMSQWSRVVGIDRQVIHSRIKLGWSVEKTLTTPINKKKQKEKE